MKVFYPNERVVLTKVHHKHTDGIKAYKGKTGTVIKAHSTTGEYLIAFDTSVRRGNTYHSYRWWIKPNYLTKLD